MNLVDKLLAVDAKEIKEKETAQIEIKRLSKLIGEPFIVTVQSIDSQRYIELSSGMLDKKSNVDYSKVYKQNTLIVLEGIVEPNLKDEKLQKHFGAASPKDLAEILFQGGAMSKISGAICAVSGFDEDTDEIIKN